MLKFNIEQLEDKCTINSNDEIFSEKTEKIVDSITINALTINIFSVGKNLIDYIESFCKVNIPDKYKDLKENILSKRYDGVFSYRLGLFLRNYSQHGHLPVSVHVGKCCFDLNQTQDT